MLKMNFIYFKFKISIFSVIFISSMKTVECKTNELEYNNSGLSTDKAFNDWNEFIKKFKKDTSQSKYYNLIITISIRLKQRIF